MILGDGGHTDGNAATLDGLFRRAGVRRPEALALADPPNLAAVTGGAPRALTYAQADRAISALAARLHNLGLFTDSIVAIQLGNTVESVIALLGVLRAGMIAAPLPLLWRQQDIIEALGPLGPKAIITAQRSGTLSPVDAAMQVAAELFPVRYVCAFGDDVPDGIVPLDDIFDMQTEDVTASPHLENPAAHVAAVTFDVSAKGTVAVARSHAELIAGGLAVFLESGLPRDALILSPIPASSFAGLATALLPWLISGGTLHLHHGFDADAFAAQCAAVQGGAVIAPGPVLAPLTRAGHLESARHILAFWRAPERMAGAALWQGNAVVTDIACFGEAGLCAGQRLDNGRATTIPLGEIKAPREGPQPVTVLETMRTKTGTVALRGPMVPKAAFPPGVEHGGGAFFAPAEDGFVDTGFMCRLDRVTQELTVTGPAAGFAAVGGYRFRPGDLEARVATADPGATIVALPDALLGERLAGSGRDRTPAFLRALGHNPLIAGAFRPRKADAAA